MLSSSHLPLQGKNEYKNWNEFKSLKIGNQILQETLNLMQLIDKIAPPQFLFKKNCEIRCKFLKVITSYIYSTVKCISAFYLNSFSEPESAKFRTIH